MSLPIKLHLIAVSLVCALLGIGQAWADGERIVIVTGVVYPGQEISSNMIKEVTLVRPLRTRAEVAREAAEVVGKVARRTILPRRAISVSSLREAYVVEAGESVRIVYLNGGLKITLTGVALVSGASGSSIRVRNQDSGRIVTGIVTPEGSVVVEPL